jgi:1-acyl-sn-glycerol-3-phosphate acyltransferase
MSNSSDASQFALITQRRFAPFFWTQFCGAANDNIFKYAFTILMTYKAAQWGGFDPKIAGFLIGAIFILPFVLFSGTSGQLADKYEKSFLMRMVKNLEIAIMVVAAVGFVMKSAHTLFVVTFLMGLHSTLFGPVKYAYLPQHLKPTELTGGNGLVEMGTFVAILLGTILGGSLVRIGTDGADGPMYVAIASLVVAVIGRVFVQFVPQSPAPEPTLKVNWNPITETIKNLSIAKQNRAVFLSILGISWLWFFGTIFLTSFAPFSKDVLGGNESVVTVLLATFSIGIAIGSLLCEMLSGKRIELGLVPFGSIGMTVFAVDLYFASKGLNRTGEMTVEAFLAMRENWRIMADLFLLAMFAGFYSVPLYALIQSRCEPQYRARIIGANNIVNAIFMIAASLLAAVLLKAAGFTLPQLFLVTGILNALVAIYIYTLLPEFLMRFITWIAINTIYRVKAKGLENIPDEGACVVVCNHVSFVDAMIIGGMIRRPVRFVMDHRIFKIPLLGFVFRTARCIPIAPRHEDPEALVRAMDSVAEGLAQGDLIGIFPEGKLTDHGEINEFKGGIAKIVERTPVPVVPMALQGFWGSFFSRKGGAAMTKPLRRGVFSKIGLNVGEVVPAAQVTPQLLQQKVLELRGEWK